MKEKTWEIWFVISVILLLAFLFVGTIDGFLAQYPNVIWGGVGAIANIVICCIVGMTPDKEKED